MAVLCYLVEIKSPDTELVQTIFPQLFVGFMLSQCFLSLHEIQTTLMILHSG